MLFQYFAKICYFLLKYIVFRLKLHREHQKIFSVFLRYFDFPDILNILFSVQQESVAGLLFSNVYTWDMFFKTGNSKFSTYPYYNTPFASGQNHEKLIN